MELAEIGKNILINCMNVKPGENVLIVTDDEKYAIGQALYQAAKLLKAEAMLMTMPAREVSGPAPPGGGGASKEGGGCGNLPHENIDYAYTRQN